MMGRMTVSEKSDKSAKTVSIYATLAPSTLLSTFDIDMKKKSNVEIFAKNFGAVWGKFSCTPVAIL
ncbi:MAG: hypothetical protein AB7F59_08800 [Bdellovibrionales bacterium]